MTDRQQRPRRWDQGRRKPPWRRRLVLRVEWAVARWLVRRGRWEVRRVTPAGSLLVRPPLRLEPGLEGWESVGSHGDLIRIRPPDRPGR